jgi:hypothetical protein
MLDEAVQTILMMAFIAGSVTALVVVDNWLKARSKRNRYGIRPDRRFIDVTNRDPYSRDYARLSKLWRQS